MGLVASLFALEQTFVNNPAQWLVEMFGGRPSATGITVTEATAMQAPAVFSSVAAVAETMGSLPLMVYRRRADGGKEPDPEHSLHPIVHLQPNPEIVSMLWREMSQAHLMLGGNAYSEIVRNQGGEVLELWPIHPQRMTVERHAGELVYLVSVPGGTRSVPGQPIRTGTTVTLSADQVLHIRALSLDAVMGVSRVKLHAESIGLSLALEEFGARFFGNGAVIGGLLEHPGKLGGSAQDRLAKQIDQHHGGLSRSHRTMVLEEGMKYHEVTLAQEKAQFIQTRQFQVGETGRIMRVPGVLIGHDDKTATYASAEQFFLAYVVHTIRPWAVRWDQWLTVGLLTPTERQSHFIEHQLDGLLRGDVQARTQALQLQFLNGAITLDEWRALENRNPIPGGLGRQHFVPLNVRPLDQLPLRPAAGSMDEEPAALARAYRTLVEAAAGRTLRREREAVQKQAERDAAKPVAWATWVRGFYDRHAAYVAEALGVTMPVARAYADAHRDALLAEGLGALERWITTGNRELLALVGLEPRGGSADADADAA